MNGLGSDWQILNTTYKPWPCCRWIHHPLTAFTRLRDTYGLRPEEIERVVVRANPFALTPIFCEQQPTDPLSAEFSHAHALAASAYDIPAGPLWYERDTMGDTRIASFRNRVSVVPEPTSSNLAEWMTGGQWRGIPAGVDIHARGEVFSATADHSLGDPWTDATLFSDEAIRSKFNVMAGLGADGSGNGKVQDAVGKVVDAVSTLETGQVDSIASSLAELSEVMVRARRD